MCRFCCVIIYTEVTETCFFFRRRQRAAEHGPGRSVPSRVGHENVGMCTAPYWPWLCRARTGRTAVIGNPERSRYRCHGIHGRRWCCRRSRDDCGKNFSGGWEAQRATERQFGDWQQVFKCGEAVSDWLRAQLKQQLMHFFRQLFCRTTN